MTKATALFREFLRGEKTFGEIEADLREASCNGKNEMKKTICQLGKEMADKFARKKGLVGEAIWDERKASFYAGWLSGARFVKTERAKVVKRLNGYRNKSSTKANPF